MGDMIFDFFKQSMPFSSVYVKLFELKIFGYIFKNDHVFVLTCNTKENINKYGNC